MRCLVKHIVIGALAHLEVSPLKRQVNIAFINKGIAICGILVLLQLPIVVIICHFYSKSWYIILFLL
jgi:hypothetical protein